MKRETELNILLIAVWGGIAALIIWTIFGTGIGARIGTWKSAAGTSALGFGNCSVQYQWRSRNNDPREILNLVVLTESPTKIGVNQGGTRVFAVFSDGSSSAVAPDASSIAWLAPGKPPQRIPVADLRTIVTVIEQHSDTSSEAQFNSPEEFLAGIQKLAAQTDHTEHTPPSS